MKTLRKLRIEENFLNFIKGIYEEPSANITFNVETLIAKIRNKIKFSVLTTFSQYYTRGFGWYNKIRREIKGIQMDKKN